MVKNLGFETLRCAQGDTLPGFDMTSRHFFLFPVMNPERIIDIRLTKDG